MANQHSRFMRSTIILGIKNTIKSFAKFVIELPTYVKHLIQNAKNDINSLRLKLGNLLDSNIELGIYHIKKGNYKDAIFRFKLVEKFLDSNNDQACYWLGVVYLLKSNHKQSIVYLQKSKHIDNLNLLNFVKSINDIKIIPIEVYQLLRNITMDSFVRKFINNSNDIPKILISELKRNISSLPQNYNILDLGSNVGLLAHEIHKRLPDGFHLTGIEVSDMIDQQYLQPADNLYNKSVKSLLNKTAQTIFPHEYLNNNEQRYDIICSLNGFSTQADLSNIFRNIYIKLNENGYFAFTVNTALENELSEKMLEFSYNISYLHNLLTKVGFEILSVKEFIMEIKNNCSIFVCKKQFKNELKSGKIIF